MKILYSRVVNARRERELGRVEARVHMLVQPTPSSRPQGQSLVVSVPAYKRRQDVSLRKRVEREAALMAQLMHQTEQRLALAVS
ncbi:MAG: hypothetical protein AAFY03_03035 [Pseudomonadota bacterium]